VLTAPVPPPPPGPTNRECSFSVGSAPQNKPTRLSLTSFPLSDVQMPSDVFFLIYGATMVFFMQSGFALLEVGSGESPPRAEPPVLHRPTDKTCTDVLFFSPPQPPPHRPSSPFTRAVSIRNTKNTLFKNLLDVCCSAIAFYLFGFAFLHSREGEFIGTTDFALGTETFTKMVDLDDEDVLNMQAYEYSKWFYSFAFAATSTTIVSGAVAERFKFKAYAVYSMVITALVYPVVAHWCWSEKGWASPLTRPNELLLGVGAVDYAGSGVVHVTGGLAALIACVAVGPRVGRYNRNIVMEMPMQSPVFQTIGTLFMWFSWYGFNSVATMTLQGGASILAAKSVVTTTLSAAMGGATVMLLDHLIPNQKMEPRRMNNGVLCGLVSISGCAGMIDVWFSIVIGFIAGIVYVASSKMLIIFRVDDVVDAVPIHLFGGIWGTIAPAFFMTKKSYLLKYPNFPRDEMYEGKEYKAPCGLFMGCENSGSLLGANLLMLLALVLWVTVICSLTIYAVQWSMHTLRVNLNDEMKGIDASQHGGRSYTEFQTTVFTFKTRDGAQHSMEMRVRAGDAAKFAMALSEVMEGSTHNSSDSAGIALQNRSSSRADKSMAYAFKDVEEGNRTGSASPSPGGSGGSSRDQSPSGRNRGQQSAPGYGYWDNVHYQHDRSDKDVAITIPESNGGTEGSQGSSAAMKSEQHSAGSVLDPFGDAQREG